MKYWIFLLALILPTFAFGAEPGLKDVYGGVFSGCTVASDIDEGEADRIGPLSVGFLYVVFCYDSSDFSGVACKIKQGTVTVDASSGEGSDGEAELLFAGEKRALWISPAMTYISFEPVADGTTQIGVACKMN